MSMMDDSPSNYIKDGKICKFIKGKSYYSCGFYDHDPDTITKVCDATDDAIAVYLENNDSLYDYDKCKYLDKSDIKPICEDKFGNNIYTGSRIVLLDMHFDDSFRKFATGTVVGETNEYVKIKSDDPNMHKRYAHKIINGKHEWVRFEAPYILRRKDSKRFLLIRKLK